MTERELSVPVAARVLPRISHPRRALSLLAVGSVVGVLTVNSGFFTAKADQNSNKWASLNEAGEDSNGAEAQPGNTCEGTWGIPTEANPGWVRVGGSGSPDTPIVRAEGQILDPDASNGPLPAGIENMRHTNAWPNFEDNTSNHWNRDFNLFLTVDQAYKHLLATPGQFIEGEANEAGNLEVEWERGTVPEFAMPAVGDRLTVWGAHIWDCGHGDFWAEGAYPMPVSDSYRAEIHPPMGWVAYRQTADADGVPQNGKQHQNPWKWYQFTDLQGMAETLPNTALRDTPVHATVADAYFSSYGGNVIESLNGCANDSPSIKCWDTLQDRPELHEAESHEWQQKVLNNDYEFFVPAPHHPANAEPWSRPVWDVESRCAEIPPDPTHAYKNHPESTSGGGVEGSDGAANSYWADKGIGAATCNPTPNNKPPFTVVPTVQNDQPGFVVTVRAKTGQDGIDGTADDPVYPNNDYIAFAYRFKVAWDVAPKQPAATVRVDFDDMHVYHDAEGACTSDDGEWVMMLRANEQSVYPVNGEGDDNDAPGPADDPFWEAGAVDDERDCGDGSEPNPCVGGPDDEYKTYNLGTGSDTLTRHVQLAPGQKVNIWERTYDKDPSVDETFCVVDEFLPVPAPGQTDPYTLGLANEELWGSHTLDVRLTNVTEPSIESELVVGAPKFGPNQDTGGLTRVGGQTPLSVVPEPGNEPADGAQYRVWKGSNPPTTWINVPGVDQTQVDLGTPFAGLPDGEYYISGAALRAVPNSSDVLVGEHTTRLFQVDTTPPKLAMPANVLVPATETGGAHVDFVVSATDNYDPQPVLDNPSGNPTITCDHKSGELFPQGLNQPKTTKVTCTATDAVGNSATSSFDVTVYSPFGYLDDFVALGWQWAEIGRESKVWTGNVGAYDSSDGVAHAPLGYPNIELATGKGAWLEPHTKLAAESIWLEADTKAGGVWWVDEFNTGAGATYTSHQGYVPLWACPAAFPAFSAGGVSLTYSSTSDLMAGSWGDVVVMPGVTLHALGGDYYLQSLTLMDGARLEVQRPSRFFVDGPVTVGAKGYIGPRPGYPVQAHDIEMYVTGTAGSTPAFLAGDDVVLTLNVQTRDGLLQVGDRATATGAFLGPMVQFGHQAALYLDSVFTADYCSEFPEPRPEPPPCMDGSGTPIPCPPRRQSAARDG